MSNKALTISTILLVIILSTIFFWQTTNRFLYPSRAQIATGPGTGANLTPATVKASVVPTRDTSMLTPGPNNGKLTPAPTTQSSGPGNCPGRPQGDFDCNGVIDLVDFNKFRVEYAGQSLTKEADSNSDGKIDLLDFDNWRKNATLLQKT